MNRQVACTYSTSNSGFLFFQSHCTQIFILYDISWHHIATNAPGHLFSMTPPVSHFALELQCKIYHHRRHTNARCDWNSTISTVSGPLIPNAGVVGGDKVDCAVFIASMMSVNSALFRCIHIWPRNDSYILCDMHHHLRWWSASQELPHALTITWNESVCSLHSCHFEINRIHLLFRSH